MELINPRGAKVVALQKPTEAMVAMPSFNPDFYVQHEQFNNEVKLKTIYGSKLFIAK